MSQQVASRVAGSSVGAGSSKEEEKSKPQSGGSWVLVATILGSSMVFIDGAVVSVALPRMQSELQASVADMQLVVEAYTLFLAALLLVGGSLGDRYGRRLVYGIGVVLFTAASIWCGLAGSAGQLIVARSIQGIGGAMLVPGSLAIISAFFNGPERGRAIGTWSGFTSITTALGPVIGGFLVEHASWRWVFFLNVPLAVAVLLLLVRVPESRDTEGKGRLDWAGALLATVGLGGLIYGLIDASNLGLGNLLILAALAVGIVSLVLFVVVESRIANPMMRLDLFRSPTFSGANLLTFLLYGALGGALFFLPFDLQQVQGYSPTAAGLAFLPFVLLMFTLSRWSGGLVQKYGAKLPLIIGPVIAALGFVLFALPGVGGSYWTTFFPAIVVLGVGMAVTVAPLTTSVMNAVPVNRSGIASGINNAVSRTAGLVAIAVLGIVAFSIFSSSLNSNLAGVTLSPQLRQQIDNQRNKLAGIEIPQGVDAATRANLQTAIGEAYVDSFRVNMLVAAGLALLSAGCAAVLVAGKGAERQAEEAAYKSGKAVRAGEAS